MTKTEKISLQSAKKLILKSMLLDGRTDLSGGKERISQILDRLGYIQIDTISVIERAHHHTIWNRVSDYKPNMLDELLANDRLVFEYWGHAASYLPMKDYRYFLPRMKYFADPHGKWEKERVEKYGTLMAPVIERIRNEGALASSDFELPDKKKKEAWWDWHGVKTALELMYWKGELMVSGRRKFEKLYDLTERVLPAWVDTNYPTEVELGRFLVKRALQAQGIASEKEIANYIIPPDKKVIKKALKILLETGEIIKLTVEGLDKSEYFVLPGVLDSVDNNNSTAPLYFLSPFDNLIIQRDRILNFWKFDYALECYTTPAKRIFGYFALPILWKDMLVGKIDAKADRKSKSFIVRKIGLEDWFNPNDEYRAAFDTALQKMAAFNGCNNVIINS